MRGRGGEGAGRLECVDGLHCTVTLYGYIVGSIFGFIYGYIYGYIVQLHFRFYSR